MSAHDLHIFRIFLSGFFMIAGIALTAITPVIQKRRRTWPKAEAEISSISHGEDPDQVTVYVTYETNEGIPYTTALGYYQSTFKVGQKIPICYDPQDPKHVTADTDALVALTVCLSVLFLIVGAVIFFVMGAAMKHSGL